MLFSLLIITQIVYNRNWDDNLCPELKDLTLIYLIYIYILFAANIVHFIFFASIACCDCDYVEEYDYNY